MIKKILLYTLLIFPGLSSFAQQTPAPAVDPTKLLFDVNGGDVAFTAISATEVQWGDGFGDNNKAFISALRQRVISLPVVLSSFKALKEADKVNIKWSTTSEKNFSHFEVLRSVDGKSFSSIAVVTSTGNSNTRVDYSFKDANPFQGVNYYQLKMVDRDGTSKESIIVSVDFDINKADVVIISNSDLGTITFNIYSPQLGPGQIDIVDVNGKKLLSKAVDFEKGNNSFNFKLSIANQLLISVVSSPSEKVAKKFYY